jgi:hypothetical protein
MTVAEAVAAPPPWTADNVLCGLYQHFVGQSWACLVELGAVDEQAAAEAKAAWDAGVPVNGNVLRRIDMLLLRRPRKGGIGDVERLAIEVKVTRGDFLGDVRNPDKQATWRTLAHRHAYAVPAGMVEPEEVPGDSGLIVVTRGTDGWRPYRVRWARRAPYTATPDLPAAVVLNVAWRAATAAARRRGWIGRGEDVAALRERVHDLEQQIERAHRDAYTAGDKAALYKGLYAAAAPDGLPCSTCGVGLRPAGIRRGSVSGWRHSKRAQDAVCEPLRVEQARVDAQARWDALTDDERADWTRDRGWGSEERTPDRIIAAWAHPAGPQPVDVEEP